MLTYPEIAQLSDRDLSDELSRTRNSIFRQKIGVNTGHLKDSHLVRQLKTYVARLLTESNRRKKAGEKVEKSAAEVTKKIADETTKLAKTQAGKKKKAVDSKESIEKEEPAEEKAVEKETKDVKVKKIEKKGWFGRQK